MTGPGNDRIARVTSWIRWRRCRAAASSSTGAGSFQVVPGAERASPAGQHDGPDFVSAGSLERREYLVDQSRHDGIETVRSVKVHRGDGTVARIRDALAHWSTLAGQRLRQGPGAHAFNCLRMTCWLSNDLQNTGHPATNRALRKCLAARTIRNSTLNGETLSACAIWVSYFVDEAHRQAWSTRPEIAARMNPQAPAVRRLCGRGRNLRTAGYEVRAHGDGLLTSAALADVDVLVIPHCSDEEWGDHDRRRIPVHPDELAAIEDFVAAGGGLIVLAETEQKSTATSRRPHWAIRDRRGVDHRSDPVHRFRT